MRTYSHTFFSKKAGLEIRLGFIEKDNIKKGKIFLRAFPIEAGLKEKQISVMLTPEEAFSFFLTARKVVQSKKSQRVIVHRNKNGSGEYITNVSLDYWERNGKSGYGVTVQRRYDQDNANNANISISLTQIAFHFLVETLKRWSVNACFEEK